MSAASDRPAALPERCHALIVGGGASGLTLATHLAGSEVKHRDVVVVDDGSRPLADRAWAYWSASAPAAAAGSAAFDRFWVRTDDIAHLVELDRFRYRTVTGVDLDRAADAALLDAPGFTRVRGHVTEIRDGPHQARVVVDGHAVRADWVFDSVGIRDPAHPRAPLSTLPGRLGHSLVFTGRRIETDVDIFDPIAPTLMDFRTAQGRDLAFVYLLPSTPRTALVEHTRFHTADGHVPSGVGSAALDTYVRDVLGVRTHRVLATEHGRIPLLTARPPRPGRRVVLIGTPAGMIKASTGYGYARILRHSADLARSLATHGHPFDVPGPSARHRALDRVLLEAIRREPAQVIDAFARLFAANPGDRVLAFLDERTTVPQELATIVTLPPAPFLRAVAALASGRGRTGSNASTVTRDEF